MRGVHSGGVFDEEERSQSKLSPTFHFGLAVRSGIRTEHFLQPNQLDHHPLFTLGTVGHPKIPVFEPVYSNRFNYLTPVRSQTSGIGGTFSISSIAMA